MAEAGPPDVPDFSGWSPDDFLRMFNPTSSGSSPGSSPGPVNWDTANQLADMLASVDPETNAPRPDPPVEAADAGALRGLVQAAQSYVAGATGIPQTLAVPINVVTRQEWTRVTLDGLRPVLETLARQLNPAAAAADPVSEDLASQDMGDLPRQLMASVAPMLFGVQAGTLAGMLSQYALGQYDLPLPLAGEPALAFIVHNIDAFAREWSLPPEDLRFALALREVVHSAQRSIPWVRERLLELSVQFVSGYEFRPEALGIDLGDFDLGQLDLSRVDFSKFDPATFDPATFDPATFDPATFDPAQLGLGDVDFSALDEQMGELIGADPSKLLEGMRTPQQAPALAELQRFGAVLAGHADIILTTVGDPMIPELGRIDEALRRHRVERGRLAAFVDQMLGLALDREHYEAGAHFCQGVVERVGLNGLNRLFENVEMIPTPNEFVAPGLWLARIELRNDD